MNKRDITSSRTATDIERKYGKRISDTEKEAKSQGRDLASLDAKTRDIMSSIDLINSQIAEINQMCSSLNELIEDTNEQLEEDYDELNESVGDLNTRLIQVEDTSHAHSNKPVLDTIRQQDINNWNDQFDGTYNVLAENIVVNQQIQGINQYNLILLQISNLNRYIPCFKYGDTYAGINVTKDTAVDMEEISIEIQNETVINIVCSNSILKIIGIF